MATSVPLNVTVTLDQATEEVLLQNAQLRELLGLLVHATTLTMNLITPDNIGHEIANRLLDEIWRAADKQGLIEDELRYLIP